MASRPLTNLSAVRKQQLLVEYSGLKSACPHGVYMSLTPGDPTLWSGVLFIRKGPYAPAILRFQISFPSSYPSLPPLITFSTDIFHPLVTPLTTYMYTTDIQDSGTVSATDEERLPPGGFSLRNGFPGWFGRGSRRSAERNQEAFTPGRGSSGIESPISQAGTEVTGLSPTPGKSVTSSPLDVQVRGMKKGRVSTYEVLRYIRSSFDDEDVLDNVPLEAAGNPGAWHAWRTHRVKLGKIQNPTELQDQGDWRDRLNNDGDGINIGDPDGHQRPAECTSPPVTARRPGEWNWDGVWEVRVKKGIEASLSEAILFGGTQGDDLIRFLHMDEDEVSSVKENIMRCVESQE